MARKGIDIGPFLEQFAVVLDQAMAILDPWTKIWAARTRIWDKNGSIGDQFRIRKRVPLIVCNCIFGRMPRSYEKGCFIWETLRLSPFTHFHTGKFSGVCTLRFRAIFTFTLNASTLRYPGESTSQDIHFYSLSLRLMLKMLRIPR